jgi:hypothetical protein
MVCEHHEALIRSIKSVVATQKEANGDMKEAIKALNDGKVMFSNIKTRLTLIERIVLGACGLILTSFILALIVLIFR